MALFIIGFIVGVIVAEAATLFVLGLGRAAAIGDRQGELERMENEQRKKNQITGKF